MTTQTNTIETKVIASFISELGYTPVTVKIDGEIAYADGYSCRILNGKSIKKVHGLAWRLDRY